MHAWEKVNWALWNGGGGVPLQPAWGEEGDPSQSLFTPAPARGRLGKTPLLWDGVCGEEYAPEAHDQQGAVWSGPSMRTDIQTPEIKVKHYHQLPELSLMDLFKTMELSLFTNKSSGIKNMKQPPTLIPVPRQGSHSATNPFTVSAWEKIIES